MFDIWQPTYFLRLFEVPVWPTPIITPEIEVFTSDGEAVQTIDGQQLTVQES